MLRRVLGLVWRLCVVLPPVVGAAPGLAAAAINSCPGLIAVYGWNQRPLEFCEQQGKIAQESFYIGIDCRTGGSAGIFPMTCSGVTMEEYDAKGGPHPPNDCVPSVTPVFQINDCDATGKAPDPSKTEASKCEAYFADPVSLATGALQQRATDLDLGSGLRFERFYSSDLYGAAYAPTAELAPMGQKWEHGLDWRMRSALTPAQASYGEAYFIRRPLRVGVVFVRPASFATFSTSASFGGSLAKLAGGSFLFTDEDGTRVSFDAALQLTGIQPPGAPPITVTASEGTQTFTQGTKSLAITLYGGPAHAGRVASVTGGGQTFTYTYDYDENLETVTGPDTSSGESGAAVTWTYSYDATDPAGHLVSVEREAGSTTKVLGSWSFDGQRPRRVISVDDPALDLPVAVSYEPVGGAAATTLTRTLSTGPHAIASFFPTDGRITATTGLGSADVPLVARAAAVYAYVDPGGGAAFASSRWHTRQDLDGRTTLYEDYARDGAPGRVVEGWVDSASGGGAGVFSANDTYARLREYVWHPWLTTPTLVREVSPLTHELHDATLYDYGSPATDRLQHIIRQGKTLDATGSAVDFSYVTTFTYEADGLVKTVAGPRPSNFTEYVYNPDTRFRTAVRHYLAGAGSAYLETRYRDFDARGNPQTIIEPNRDPGADPAYRLTRLTYDGAGRIKTVTPPWSETGSSSTIQFTYSVDGDLTQVNYPLDTTGTAHVLKIGRDAKRRVTFIAESNGDAIVYAYTDGRRARESLYRGFQNLEAPGTLVGDARFGYDDAGRLVDAFSPLFAGDGVATHYAHSDGGNVALAQDENGRQDSYLYTALDQLRQIDEMRAGPVTYTTGIGYDERADLEQISDPAASVTSYQRDDLGRLVRLTSPDTGTTLYLYDEAGNRIEKVEGFGVSPRSTRYEYDGLDRVVRIDTPNDPDWIFSYDTDAAKNQKGRLASVTNGSVTTAFWYTDAGQVSRERTTIDGAAYDVVTTYDASGNVRTLTGPSGIGTAADFLGRRPRTVSVTGGAATQSITELEFYPFGPRSRAKLPPYAQGQNGNVVTSERQHNLRGQVEHIQVTGPGGLTALDLTYTYNLTGGGLAPNDPGPDLDRVVDGVDGTRSRYYRYDDLARLGEATSLSGTVLAGFGYDAAGNRTASTGPSGSLAYDYDPGTNRLSQRRVGASVLTHYHHDAFGRRDYAGASPYAGAPNYLYNEASRIVSVSGQIPAPVYTYDGFGRRIKKTAGFVTTLFFYDAQGQLLEEITSPAFTGSPVRRYVFVEGELLGIVSDTKSVGVPARIAPLLPDSFRPDPGAALFVIVLGLGAFSLPLLRRRAPLAAVPVVLVGALSLGDSCTPAPPSFAWVHTDALGTPLAVTATTAASPTNPVVIWQAAYEPFGAATVSSDPDGDGSPFSLNVRFPGQYYDSETALHYNFYRTYDPATGRYLEPDPIGQRGGLNPFAYARGNPISNADRTGLFVFALPAIGVAASSAGAAAVVSSLTLVTAAVLSYAQETISTVLNASEDPSPDGAPPIPSEVYGNNPQPSAGRRINTDLPAEDFERALKDLTGGRLTKTDKPGRSECPNGVGVRAPDAGRGPRIDVPANGSKPPETIHFPEDTPWPF